jgi:hypothetical protein
MSTDLSLEVVRLKSRLAKLEQRFIDEETIEEAGTGRFSNHIYLFASDTLRATRYDDLWDALNDAGDGDAVWLPASVITGDYTVPAGVSVVGRDRARSILTGQITLNNESALLNLSVIRSANDSSALVGVDGPESGTGFIYDCDVIAIQSGTGTGYAVGLYAGEIYVEGGYLNGSTATVLDHGFPESLTPSYSSTVLGKVLNLGTGGSEPSGWTGGDFDDTSWSVPILLPVPTFGPAITGTQWVTAATSSLANIRWLLRHQFTLPEYDVISAVLQVWEDNQVLGVWINGVTAWEGRIFQGTGSVPTTITLDSSLFVNGTNIIGFKILNGAGEDIHNPTALSYKLTLGFSEAYNSRLLTSGVRMTQPTGTPARGDRSAWDAILFPERHANDLPFPTGLHHTLGYTANQAAPGNHSHAVGALSDVDLTGLADGDALVYDEAQNKWEPGPGGGAAALNDLSDVVITTPTVGQVIKYNGSVWANGTDNTGEGGGAGIILPVTRTYVANQLDGIFYWLGTGGLLNLFQNPARTSLWSAVAHYTATQSSDQDATRVAYCATDGSLNELTGSTHTQNTANSWWKADFGSGREFTITRVGMVGRNDAGLHPRNWKVQGSNNDSDWTDLLTVTDDGPSQNTWYSSAIADADAYRYIRIYMTGANSSGSNFMTIGEIEFWGTLAEA